MEDASMGGITLYVRRDAPQQENARRLYKKIGMNVVEQLGEEVVAEGEEDGVEEMHMSWTRATKYMEETGGMDDRRVYKKLVGRATRRGNTAVDTLNRMHTDIWESVKKSHNAENGGDGVDVEEMIKRGGERVLHVIIDVGERAIGSGDTQVQK